jgi:hypothetical protein
VTFDQIEALTDLSGLSRVDLFNLLGRAEQLHRRFVSEWKRRHTESTSSTRDITDHGGVGVVTPGLTGTWPIMHFQDGQRVSITWFKGTLRDAYIKRNGLMIIAVILTRLAAMLTAACRDRPMPFGPVRNAPD